VVLISCYSSINVTNLWFCATLLVAVLPPCLVCAHRRGWQFTIRELLLLFVVAALVLGLTRHEILEVLDGAKRGDYRYRVYLPFKGKTPEEVVVVIWELSLIYTIAIYCTKPRASDDIAASDEAEPPRED
jgi:hypothetical protein